MMDRYSNFSDLAAGETDFSIELADRGSGVTVIAPHGGEIEPHSADIARLICADDYNLFCFIGTKPSGNRDLHITSHRFDHPGALALVKRSSIVIAVHGCTREDLVILLGGLDQELIAEIDRQLGRRNIDSKPSSQKLRGQHKGNICNRGLRGKGVQLEISRGLRDCAAAHRKIAAAVRAAVTRLTDDRVRTG
jgi:phage replication-related protein YjqB (UPF0714/DUF867 family)